MNEQRERRRILLIDDSEQGLIARRYVLEESGYEVRTAPTGEQGLEEFRACLDREPFSLVVTDNRLPGMRGEEVIRRLRETAPATPVVVLIDYAETCFVTPDSTEADEVLVKGPREQFDLVDAARRLVSGRPAERGKPPASETDSLTGRAAPPARRTGTRGGGSR